MSLKTIRITCKYCRAELDVKKEDFQKIPCPKLGKANCAYECQHCKRINFLRKDELPDSVLSDDTE